MAWQYFPIENDDDMQDFRVWEELVVSLDERHKILGEEFWPPQNSHYDTGESFSLSGSGFTYTLTDSSKNWTLGSPPSGCSYGGTHRFVNYSIDCPPADNSNVPEDYDVIFDHDEHRRVVRAQITGGTNTTLVLSMDVPSLIAQGVISSLSDLTSRKYFIIKRNGVWHSDRWPEFVNSIHLGWRGSVDQFVSVVSIPSYSGILKNKKFRRVGHTDLVIVESGSNWIAIEHQAAAPSGTFQVIDDDDTTVLHSGTCGSTTNGVYELTDKWTNRNTWNASRPVSWADGKWNSKQMIVGGSDGHVHRIDITGNKMNIVLFGSTTFTPTGEYAIVNSGAFHVLGHQEFLPSIWYRGIREGYWTHQPDSSDWPNNLGVIDKPIWQIEFKDAGSPEFCGPDPQYHDAFDRDVWSSIDNVCGGWTQAEKNFSPHLFKTIRSWQNDALGIGSSFVKKKDYVGETAIPYLVPARLLHEANVNEFTSTTSRYHNTAGGADDWNLILGTFSSLPYSPIEAHYVVLDEAGDNWTYGTTTITAGVPVNLGGNHPEEVAGRTVLWSYGFTRKVPLHFRYWPTYEKTIFIPDYETKPDDLGIPEVVVYYPPEIADYCCEDQEEPPEECCRDFFGRGQWIIHGGSSTYLERNGFGFVQDGGRAFQVGDVARFVGDCFADPALGGLWNQELSPDGHHWDRFYRGRHNPVLQQAYDDSKRGEATSGDTKSLTDSTKNWFVDWYGDGEMRTETGTASGGSSSTLVDSSRIPVFTGDGNELAGMWMLDRKLDNTGYKDFIIEIDKVDTTGEEPITTTFKTPITSVNPTTATITFVPVTGLTVASGDTYRIVEPSELNKWKNRDVEITYPNGDAITKKIKWNDATTMWFDTALSSPIVEGCTYKIIEPEFGTTWKWDGSKWVKPTGSDPRGEPWKDDSRLNLEHHRIMYGPVMAGDVIDKDVLNELYRVIDRLRWLKMPAAWTSRQDPDVLEENVWSLLDQANPIGCGTMDSFDPQTGDTSDPANFCLYTSSDNEAQWQAVVDCYTNPSIYGILPDTEYDGTPPQLQGYGHLGHDAQVGANQNYAYGVITGYSRLLNSEKDFFAKGQIDLSDSEEHEGEQFCEPSTDPYGNVTTDCWFQASDPYSQDYKVYYTRTFVKRTFDASGTPLTFRTFCKYHTTSSMDERVVSSKLGENSNVEPASMPHHYKYCVENNTYPTQTGQVRIEKGYVYFGYIAVENTCILRYDVAGGLTKVS